MAQADIKAKMKLLDTKKGLRTEMQESVSQLQELIE